MTNENYARDGRNVDLDFPFESSKTKTGLAYYDFNFKKLGMLF